jgi:hypothetical protein
MASKAKVVPAETPVLQNCPLEYKRAVAEWLEVSPDRIGDTCPHILELEAHGLRLTSTVFAGKDGMLHPVCWRCAGHLVDCVDIEGMEEVYDLFLAAKWSGKRLTI